MDMHVIRLIGILVTAYLCVRADVEITWDLYRKGRPWLSMLVQIGILLTVAMTLAFAWNA